jgi:hypothetical protein
MPVLNITNLPAPSAEIQEYVRNKITEITNSDDTKFHNFRNQVRTLLYPERNIAFATETMDDDDFISMVSAQYQDYFGKLISATYCSFTNLGETPACLGVHNHWRRTLALNFFLETGGSDVRTCFYDQKPDSEVELPRAEFSGYFKYQDTTPKEYFVPEPNKWIAFDAKIPHSVENIETTRIYMTIVFAPDTEIEYLMSEPGIEYSTIETVAL